MEEMGSRRRTLLTLLYVLLLANQSNGQMNTEELKKIRGRMEELFKREDLIWERMANKVDLITLVDNRMEEKVFPINVKPPLDLQLHISSSVEVALAQINGNLSIYMEHMCRSYLGPEEPTSNSSVSLITKSSSSRPSRWIHSLLFVGSAVSIIISAAIWARNFLVGDLEDRIGELEEEAMVMREENDRMLRGIEEAMVKKMEQEKQDRLIREGIRAGQQIIQEVLRGDPIHWMAHHQSVYKMLNTSMDPNMQRRFKLLQQLLPMLLASGKAQLRRCDVPNLTIHVSVFFAKQFTRAQPLYEVAHKGVLDPESGVLSRIELPRFVSAHLGEQGELIWERVALWDCEKIGSVFVCPQRAVRQGDDFCGMSNFTACDLRKIAMGVGVFAEARPFGSGYLVVTNAKLIEYRDLNKSRVLRTKPVTSNFFTLDVPGGEIAKIGENYFDSRLYVMPSIPQNSTASSANNNSSSAILSLVRQRLNADRRSSSSAFGRGRFSSLELGLLALLGLIGLAVAFFIWKRWKKNSGSRLPISITNVLSPAGDHGSPPTIPAPPVHYPRVPPNIYLPPPPPPCYPVILSSNHASQPMSDKFQPTAPKFEDVD